MRKPSAVGLIVPLVLALASALVWGQSYVVPTGSGSGSGSGAGSITNLSPSGATLWASNIVRVLTNATTQLTNFSTSTSSNMQVDVSGASLTNGWIRITNDGLYYLAFSINFRFNVLTSVDRTNAFGITTNLNAPGTNFTDILVTTSGRGGTNHFTASGQGIVYCPSNTWVTLSGYTPGTAVTNDITIQRASLTAFSVSGTTFGGGSLSSLPSFVLTNAETKDVLLTAGLKVNGQQTNVDTVRITASPASMNADGIINANNLTSSNRIWSLGYLTNALGFTNGGAALIYGESRLGGGVVVSNYNTNLGWSRNIGPVTNVDATVLSALTASKALILDANKVVANPSGVADTTTFLRGDNTYAVPPGGSATPGGLTGNPIQVRDGAGAFYGTNSTAEAFIWDITNAFMGINLGGRSPNAGLEIGTSGPGSALEEAKVRIGSGTGTNSLSHNALVHHTAAGTGALQLSSDATTAFLDGNASGVFFSNPGYVTNVSFISQRRFDIPGSGSTVTLYRTNQNWQWHVLSNTTFAVDTASSNATWNVRGSNAAFAITWPATFRWWNGKTLTDAPTFQNTPFEFRVWIENGTNASIVAERELALVPGYRAIFDTNSATGDITVSGARRTNYATGAFTVDLGTDAHVDITNVVASSYSITLFGPRLGTTFSIGFLSDSTPRTLTFLTSLAGSTNGGMVWLSTNGTTSATNWLTEASKYGVICGRVRETHLTGEAPRTNIFLWGKNQTP